MSDIGWRLAAATCAGILLGCTLAFGQAQAPAGAEPAQAAPAPPPPASEGTGAPAASEKKSLTLTTAQITAHTHPANANDSAATTNQPGGGVPARGGSYADAPDGSTTLDPAAVGSAGGDQPHTNVQPYTTLNYIIAIEGTFPSRN